MKYACTHCERLSADGNLWCTEKVCLAEAKPLVFDTGDDIGDLEIVRRLIVTRTAAIYEAQRGEEHLLVKVAHSMPFAQEKIKHEAKVLMALQAKRQHPALPVLVTPYRGANVADRPYGKVAFQSETKYYLVFEFQSGEFLSDSLRSNPQPWYQNAAWITMQVADAIAFMHQNDILHLNLNPQDVYVRMDKDGYPRPILMDFGYPPALKAFAELISGLSYAAPELMSGGNPMKPTDVYGLGLVFYEMLAGAPAFPSKSRSPELVRKEIQSGRYAKLRRSDLPSPAKPEYRDTASFLDAAIAMRGEVRQQDIPTLAHEVRRLYGDPPAERQGRKFTRRTFVILAAATALVYIMLGLISALLG
jgi:serine/threonine protein kinase